MERKSVNDIIFPSNPLMNPAPGSFGGASSPFENIGRNPRVHPINPFLHGGQPSPFEMPPSGQSASFNMPSPTVSRAAHEAAMAELAAIRAENALLIEKNKRLIAELELANLKLSQLTQNKA